MQCMATNDFHSFVAIEGDMTVLKALKGVQLRKLKSQVSKVNVIKSLSFLISNFNNNFNAKGKLNEEQIIILAGDLFDRFSYESMEDVMLMFKYARQGKIGDGRDYKLDSQTVFHKWVPEYLELKASERETIHQQRKSQKSNVTSFEWKKEDLEKFKVAKQQKNPNKNLGKRIKDVLAKPEDEAISKSTDQISYNKLAFYNQAKSDVKNQPEENLKIYLKAEKKSVIPDDVMIGIVEEELSLRKKSKKKQA